MSGRVDLGKLQEAMAPMNQAERMAYLTDIIMGFEDEREVIKDDIGLVYKMAKACGFDTSTMRKAIKRSRDPEAAAEQDTAVLTYLQAMKRPQSQPTSESTHEPQPG